MRPFAGTPAPTGLALGSGKRDLCGSGRAREGLQRSPREHGAPYAFSGRALVAAALGACRPWRTVAGFS
ncbi:protein of unknown function [Pseudomonas inefficax]|uniref:Uncharacterized protein n=1 Tax=Pseudomonas inefficax TaxID=2078786 RepID=A0AAQ1P4H0_9PSED|nr:protein of unknown function [Pseudomonas inefficax]